MENEQNAVTQTGANNEGVVTQTTQKNEGVSEQGKTNEKTFTQAEVNAIVAKEKRNIPSKEEMKAFYD